LGRKKEERTALVKESFKKVPKKEVKKFLKHEGSKGCRMREEILIEVEEKR